MLFIDVIISVVLFIGTKIPILPLSKISLGPKLQSAATTGVPRHTDSMIEFGEPSTWNNLHAFKAAVADGTLHPFDAKMGVANGLVRGLASIAEHFETNPETLNRVNELTK